VQLGIVRVRSPSSIFTRGLDTRDILGGASIPETRGHRTCTDEASIEVMF
jgi:hypothetical protein